MTKRWRRNGAISPHARTSCSIRPIKPLAGPSARGWWRVPTSWSCRRDSKAQGCAGSRRMSTPCSRCAPPSVMTSGLKPGRCLSNRGSANRSTSINSRRLLASGHWSLPPCCCCFAFVHQLLARLLPSQHPKSLIPLLPLPPCRAPGVLLPTTSGNVLLPAVQSRLQKNDGHPRSAGEHMESRVIPPPRSPCAGSPLRRARHTRPCA